MNDELKLKLQAWLDGELPESEVAGLTRAIASDPQARQLIDGLKSIKAAMVHNERVVKVSDSREFYWSQIQRRIERQTPEPSQSFMASLLSHWRKLVVPLAGATAGLALLIVSLRQSIPSPAFTERTDTSSDMEALTFHDEKAGMTVVWLNSKEEPADEEETKSETLPDFFEMP